MRLLGLLYAVINRICVWFLTQTDPIRREPEGLGANTLRALGWGAVASLAGGLVFSVVMVEVGFLPTVANLVGGTSPWLGFAVHVAISTLIGMTYGILFRNEAPNFGSGIRLGSRVWLGLVVSRPPDFAPGAPWRSSDVDHEGSSPFLAFSCRSPVLRRGNCSCFSAPGTPPREMAPDGSATALARAEPTETVRDRGARALAFRAGCRCAIANHTRVSAIG